MIRRFSIVLDPDNLAPLYIGADAEAAKQLIRQRKAANEAVAGWINVRPEKRFSPSARSAPVPVATEDTEDDVPNLIEIAQGDGRKAEVREARERLDALGIEY